MRGTAVAQGGEATVFCAQWQSSPVAVKHAWRCVPQCRSSYKRATGSFAFALLVGLLLNLVLVAVLNVAIALEDPFDNVRHRHACA